MYYTDIGTEKKDLLNFIALESMLLFGLWQTEITNTLHLCT